MSSFKIIEKLALEATPDLSNIDLPTEKVDTSNPKAPGLQYIERDTKEFLALIEFSLFREWKKSNVDKFLADKGMALNHKNESHLNELRKCGEMEKAGEMDVKTLLSQSCLSDAERELLTSKYIF